MKAPTHFSSVIPEAGYALKILLLSLIVAVIILLPHPSLVHGAGVQLITQDCEINKGVCSKKYGSMVVTLDAEPKPVKTMRELTFTVTVKGAKEYDSLKLDLQMIGMQMGPNQVTLVKTGPGRYSGKGVIPVCHSGKKLWAAAVTIPGGAKVTPFLFNVL